MPRTRIERHATTTPDPPEWVAIYANTGQIIGTLIFANKSGTTTSTLEYASDQQPHRTWPLKAKYRQR